MKEGVAIAALGVGDEKDGLTAVGEFRSEAHTFIIGYGLREETESGGPLCLESLAFNSGVYLIYLIGDITAEIALGYEKLTLQDEQTAVGESQEFGYAESHLLHLAMCLGGVCLIDILLKGLQIAVESLQPYLGRNGVLVV